MNIDEFRDSLRDVAPPATMNSALQALWYDARGDWHAAHEHAQQQDDDVGAWVHAYLHRREGDQANAAHWYRQAGRPMATGALEDEWEAIADALLRAS